MHTNDESTNSTVPSLPATGPSLTALKAENEQLRQQLQKLAQEHDRARQALTALQAERDACLRCLHAWAWERVPDDELGRWTEDEGEQGTTFAEVLHKLEQRKGQ
jgi:hypothetical protein